MRVNKFFAGDSFAGTGRSLGSYTACVARLAGRQFTLSAGDIAIHQADCCAGVISTVGGYL